MPDKRIAVVTGASGGLGRAMAAEFRRAGYRVVAVCRQAPPEGCADAFWAVDLTDAGAADAIARRLENDGGHCDLLVNNAGIGSYACWEELSEAELRRVMELDFFAPVRLTLRLLPLMKQGSAVVNVASMAAHVPVACMGAYCSAKAALRLFSETLRPELAARGIRVLTVSPGRIDTGFSSRAVGRRKPPETPGRTSSNPEELARRTRRALESSRRELIYPAWYRLAAGFVRAFPGVNEAVNRRLWHLDDRS